ncbi:MAG: DJ-1/PfpI family protein [Desulfobacterales bacterium]|nr:DJ-1/PfpI family protein [Desulfobacterales bacterium]
MEEKHVLVPVAQGIEEMEAITIIDVLRRAGAKVTVASVDRLDIEAARGIRFAADCLIDDCLGTAFDLVVLPGGIPGAENLKNSETLKKVLVDQAESGRFFGAICASPAVVLHHHGLVTPGECTCHPGFTQMIDNGNVQDRAVVVSGNCVTSQGAGTALPFALKLVEILFPMAVVKDVRAGLAI